MEYSSNVIKNAQALAKALMGKGHKTATDGTDNHLVLLDVRPHGLTGSKVEKVCELSSISVNRNAVHGDVSALSPGGVRIGSPAMTTRGCNEKDFCKIADFIDRAIKICLEIQAAKGKKLKDFENGLAENEKILKMKSEVEAWASNFGYPEPMPELIRDASAKRAQALEQKTTPLAVIAAGSDSDMPHLETLKKELGKFKVDAEIRICSAHKQPGRLQSVISEYNKCGRPVMLVGCAGGTDALSGTASYLANFPVVSCPPDGMNQTCLTNPPGSSNAFIVKPANIGKFAAQMFARFSPTVAATLNANIAEKISKLEKADSKLTGKTPGAAAGGNFTFVEVASDAKPLVVIAAGSDSDMPHLETLKKELSKFKIESEIRICSAHKQPARLQAVIAEYSKYKDPIMMVGCAGGTDALSGTASYLATFPVVSCPPDGMNNTCLTNPPGSSNAFIVKPANIARFAAQMFAHHSKDISDALDANIAEKITKLEAADAKLNGKTAPSSTTNASGFVQIAPGAKPLVVIAAGSDSDMPHLERLKKEIGNFKIEAQIRICSA